MENRMISLERNTNETQIDLTLEDVYKRQALAERGYFPVEDPKTLRKIGSYLQGHPNMNETPGVDMSTGRDVYKRQVLAINLAARLAKAKLKQKQ